MIYAICLAALLCCNVGVCVWCVVKGDTPQLQRSAFVTVLLVYCLTSHLRGLDEGREP